jgi:redox-sensitive bicupin YhaK (pirin superfamily)
LAENSCIYIFGGEAFPEERLIDWNFVATSQELIDKAKQNWKDQKFAHIEGETEYIPLPQPRQK